jgi:hypothetical protein
LTTLHKIDDRFSLLRYCHGYSYQFSEFERDYLDVLQHLAAEYCTTSEAILASLDPDLNLASLSAVFERSRQIFSRMVSWRKFRWSYFYTTTTHGDVYPDEIKLRELVCNNPMSINRKHRDRVFSRFYDRLDDELSFYSALRDDQCHVEFRYGHEAIGCTPNVTNSIDEAPTMSSRTPEKMTVISEQYSDMLYQALLEEQRNAIMVLKATTDSVSAILSDRVSLVNHERIKKLAEELDNDIQLVMDKLKPHLSKESVERDVHAPNTSLSIMGPPPRRIAIKRENLTESTESRKRDASTALEEEKHDVVDKDSLLFERRKEFSMTPFTEDSINRFMVSRESTTDTQVSSFSPSQTRESTIDTHYDAQLSTEEVERLSPLPPWQAALDPQRPLPRVTTIRAEPAPPRRSSRRSGGKAGASLPLAKRVTRRSETRETCILSR